MRKLLILLTLATSLKLEASPIYLFPFPTCFYGPSSGQCTLYNSSGEDVSCYFQVRGQTLMGSYINTSEYKVLYRYMSAWINFYAVNPSNDPITYLSANAVCNTLN